jgi:nucleotide-binding universal stress UspA family protein
MYKRILVPFDGSDTSREALDSAIQLARESGGRLRIIHSLDELRYMTPYDYTVEVLETARSSANAALAQALELTMAAGVVAETALLEGLDLRLGDVVADDARAWSADLVVVGTHGRRGVGRVLLGSGAEQIIRQAPVPVLAVRSSRASLGN